MNIIDSVTDEYKKDNIPDFNVGDTVRVHVKIVEGQRERIQVFEGYVLKKQGGGISETFTVRRLAQGIGVEKTFPVHSPKVEKIELVKRGRVRRAKLNYMRSRTGKAARIRKAD
jgi:large subunit ribosomal protein L19